MTELYERSTRYPDRAVQRFEWAHYSVPGLVLAVEIPLEVFETEAGADIVDRERAVARQTFFPNDNPVWWWRQ